MALKQLPDAPDHQVVGAGLGVDALVAGLAVGGSDPSTNTTSRRVRVMLGASLGKRSWGSGGCPEPMLPVSNHCEELSAALPQ